MGAEPPAPLSSHTAPALQSTAPPRGARWPGSGELGHSDLWELPSPCPDWLSQLGPSRHQRAAWAAGGSWRPAASSWGGGKGGAEYFPCSPRSGTVGTARTPRPGRRLVLQTCPLDPRPAVPGSETPLGMALLARFPPRAEGPGQRPPAPRPRPAPGRSVRRTCGRAGPTAHVSRNSRLRSQPKGTRPSLRAAPGARATYLWPLGAGSVVFVP